MSTTEEALDDNKKAIVRSLRFPPDAWVRIVKKAKSKGIPLATFMRNAVCNAAGVPSESERLRELADRIDTMDEKPAEKPKAKKR